VALKHRILSEGDSPGCWSEIDSRHHLSRVGFEHGRPDLGLVVEVERTAMHQPALVLEAECADLRFMAVPRMMWLESFEYAKKLLKVLRRL